MPIRYEKDRNGRWKAVGVASKSELEPRELPTGSPEAKRAAGFGRAVGARATLRGRPVVWAGPDLGWQSPQSFQKAKSQGRLPKPPSQQTNKRTGWSWLKNEAKWVLKSIGQMGAGTVPTGTVPLALGAPGSMLPATQYRTPSGGVQYTSPAGRQALAGATVGALDNVLKSGEALVQGLQGKEVNPGQAAWVRNLTGTGYRVLGAKPPSDQGEFEQGFDANFRTLGINAAVTAAMLPLAPLAAGATVAGTAARGAGLFVTEQLLSTALDDNTQGNASSLAEAALGAMGIQAEVPGAIRPTDDWGEATLKSFIPNTVAAGVFGAGFSAAAGSLGFTKRWLKDRRVASEVVRSRAWAQERGLISDGEQGFVNRYSPPEFVGDLTMGRQRPPAAIPDAGAAVDVQGAQPVAPAAGMGLDRQAAPQPQAGPAMGIEGVPGGPAAGDVALEGPELVAGMDAPAAPPAAAPVPRAPVSPYDVPMQSPERVVGTADPYSPVQERLRQMESAQNPDVAAYNQWLEQNAQGGDLGMESQLQRLEAEQGDPWVDPADFDPVADPALPETDQLVRDIWNLDDAGLIAAAEAQGSVVENVNRQLASQQAFDPAGDPRFPESAAQLATAPGESLGFNGPEGLASYEASLRVEESSGLRALTDPDNNPRVARIIEGNTGRDPSEWTREDMIEGLLEQAQADNRFVIPRPNGELNRPGEVVMPVEDLGIDPSRFQFKGGVDPTTGEQLGQSLDGVEAWNTDLEGTVSAWRDPADGSAWVINGHNRVAAARRLGVGSLPVKFYEAPDAATARSIGAAQNIATGQGTPIDAAKFMRDTGVTDVAQLQQLVPGMPMRSGWAEQGLALSRLPDDAFAAVVSGDLTPARGALIGASGRTPEEMSALWRYAEKRNVSDRVLRELVSMTAPNATATPDIARQKTIWEVLGSDSAEARAFNTGLLNKAKLADRVRSLLAADRKLFGAVAARGAAERLQTGAANRIDATGSRAVADQANKVLTIFDQLKYQTGPIGDLLNQGVSRLDAEKLEAVAKGVASQVADAMERTLAGDMGGSGAAQPRAVAIPSADDVAWAEANLLSPRKLKSRLAKKVEYDAMYERVSDLIANPEKYADLPEDQVPKVPRKADDNRLQRELQNHERARRILDEVAAAEQRGPIAAEAVATAADPPAEPQAPTRLSAEERDQLQVGLVQRAIDGDEVRPPSTPEPELLQGPQVPLTRALDSLEQEGLVYGSDAAQALADELRLAAEYGYRDAAIEKASREALRQESGYYDLDPSERMASGQFRDGFRDEPAVGTGLDERAAYARQQRQEAEAAGDQERAMAWREEERQLERSRVANAMQAGEQTQQGLFGVGEYDTTAPLLNQQAPVPDAAATFQLPAELQRSSPRYGMATVNFASDLDRAAYVLANDSLKPSKAAAKFRAAVNAAGLDVGEVIAHGRKVKQAIKEAAGGGAAPQSAGQIDLPAQQWRGGGPLDEMALEGWDALDTTPYESEKTRLERQIMALKIIREVAGPDVQVRFEDEYLKKLKGPEWGGDGKATALHGGFYRLSEDLIMVRGVLSGSDRMVAEAAFHESFHRLQYLALGEKEGKVLDSQWARVKVAVGANHVTGSPTTGKPVAYSESQAVAFQRYAEARRNGQDPVVALLGGYDQNRSILEKAAIRVVAAFDRISDVVEKLFNRVALGTFDSTRGIFERARRGSLVGQADSAFEEPASGLQMMLGSDGWRSRSWDLEPIQGRAMGDASLEVDAPGPVAPTPPRRPEPLKPLKASPLGLVPEGLAPKLSPYGPLDLLNNPGALAPAELTLPESVLRTPALYRKVEVRFSNQLDQAAYLLAGEKGAAPTKAVNQLRKALEEAGYDPADVARYGREQVLPGVKNASGSGTANQQAGALIELPDQGYLGPTRLPRSEVQRLKAQMSALDQELAALDAELDQITKQAALGGCN